MREVADPNKNENNASQVDANGMAGLEMVIPPVTVEMTKDDHNLIQSFKPFIEYSTPQQKADFL
jgi:hypothetical protein